MADNKRRIVCLSTTCWRANPTRKQQVMSRMTDCEMLYFDPPVTLIAPIKDKQAGERIGLYRQPGERVSKNITVYSMPPVLPLYNKKRWINRINQRRLASFVREKMKENGFDDAVLWVYHPSYADIVKSVPHSALVYDCVDRHSAYPGLIDREVVDTMETDLAKNCDVVFATAGGLFETLSGYNKNVSLIPNGANYEMFSKVYGYKGSVPEDIGRIKKPIMGFVGALQECIDYALVAETAKKRSDLSFVFIGAPLAGVDLSVLDGLSNVHLLGPKPHGELVGYIAQFDVCLNLFREGDLAKDVSPLKFYEYLATGKPVVSTAQPLQVRDFSNAVYIMEKRDDFERLLDKAMGEQDSAMTEKRMVYGRQCSWDARVARMRELLAEHGILL